MAIVRRTIIRMIYAKRVSKIQAFVHKKPLVLQIETTNSCNARCVFCAYPGLKRKKGVMDLSLFKKIVNDYVDMGGGAISLTPIMGDPLLDPLLLERITILKNTSEISQISLSTNLIALDQYSDDEIKYLMEAIDFVQVSCGGLDSETYAAMYGINQFAKVKQSLDRLLALNNTVFRPGDIAIAFRTTDRKFERRFKRELDEYRKRGAHVSHIWTYANYGGSVESNKDLGLLVNENLAPKERVCVLPCIHLAVCWDGIITACGCADATGRGLMLGRADHESLAKVWFGERRRNLLKAFDKNKQARLPEVCRRCSAYRNDAIFAEATFRNIQPNHPLPAIFYHRFWGA